jgi:hypothetical protein
MSVRLRELTRELTREFPEVFQGRLNNRIGVEWLREGALVPLPNS